MAGAARDGGAAIRLTDLGVMVNAAEARGAAITVDSARGARLVVCSRGWALVADPDTGASTQLELPDDSFPFACLATSDATVVTGGASWVCEIDPIRLTVRHVQLCPDEEITGFAWADDGHGGVWLTTYPSCLLLRWDRASDTVSDPVPLHPTEQYAGHLAVDDDGWVYVGIGTTRRILVSFDPATGELTTLAERGATGCGQIRRGRDGQVYGHVDADEIHPDPQQPAHWLRLHRGTATPVPTAAPSSFHGRGFARIHEPVAAPWQVIELDLPEHRLRTTARPQPITLAYDSAGAELSPLVTGPTGRIHGTSNHPLQLFDVTSDGEATVYGLAPVAEAGGNICAWARWRRVLVGVAYAGGHLYVLDPAAPVQAGVNPVHLTKFDQIHRPRCVLVHGDTAIWGGYGPYGSDGGGLALTDLVTGRSRILEHDAVVPHQATTTLAMVGETMLLGATSVETPGGATRFANDAVVYLLDVAAARVTHTGVPVPGVATWSAAASGADGLVRLVSAEGLCVFVDPGSLEAVGPVQRLDLGPAAYGSGITTDEALLVVHRDGVARSGLQDNTIEVVYRSDRPLTAGGAVVGDRLYVASGSHLLELSGVC